MVRSMVSRERIPGLNSILPITSCVTGRKLFNRSVPVSFSGIYGVTHVPILVCCAVLSCSVVANSLGPHGLAHQAPLSMGILQASILEWVARLFFRASSQPRDQTQVSHIADASLPSEPPGRPRTLEWVAYPLSRGTSQPRNRTRGSCTIGGFFTSWATRDASISVYWGLNDIILEKHLEQYLDYIIISTVCVCERKCDNMYQLKISFITVFQ